MITYSWLLLDSGQDLDWTGPQTCWTDGGFSPTRTWTQTYVGRSLRPRESRTMRRVSSTFQIWCHNQTQTPRTWIGSVSHFLYIYHSYEYVLYELKSLVLNWHNVPHFMSFELISCDIKCYFSLHIMNNIDKLLTEKFIYSFIFWRKISICLEILSIHIS